LWCSLSHFNLNITYTLQSSSAETYTQSHILIVGVPNSLPHSHLVLLGGGGGISILAWYYLKFPLSSERNIPVLFTLVPHKHPLHFMSKNLWHFSSPPCLYNGQEHVCFPCFMYIKPRFFSISVRGPTCVKMGGPWISLSPSDIN